MGVLLETQVLTPPIAKKVRTTAVLHGDERIDDYAWLREKSHPDVLAYLEAENAYADALMKPTEPLQQELYAEILGRLKQTDMNVPFRKGDWFYYSRTEEGKQYQIWARKRSLDAPEEIILDVNELAEGQEYMSIGALEVSDDANLLAYATDDTGYREYTLYVKDLRTGEVLGKIAEAAESIEWAADNRTIFYSIENDAKRQYRVYRHVLGTDEHTLIYEEDDELFDVWVERSRSGDWIFLVSDSKTTSEIRIIDAHAPESAPRVVVPRREGHQYYVEHRGESFYVMTNDAGINFRVVTTPVTDPDETNWRELVPHRPPVRIESIDLFANHMAVHLWEDGLSHLEIHDLRGGDAHRVSFPEPAYALFANANPEFETNILRYTYQSFITPPSTYDYDMDTREQTLLKRTEVVGGHDPSLFKVERIFVRADDGADVPVSIVYRRDLDPHGVNPLLLYAYGSYGASMPATFNLSRLSLLGRGVVYALAHIRGGGEMGKEWHEQGRMMSKRNTFTDFIAVAEHLIEEKWTSPGKLAIMGGSAGGLLVGAVVNMRPELFKAAIAIVPFVDVMNTMLDASIPLTTQEYIEWGNPNEREAYFYMKSYCPYSNVRAQSYPAMLVRTSLNDSQVGYWEAVKWVARLRAMKTDAHPLVLRVNMGAGHGGASGRYDKLREDAHDYAWLLTTLGAR
ncbi:MAG TPA: S9 family peptidase [Thermoanaerobaculia bacterium]|nr:S9 family peptidase [Thermoanaerobaculia bacterium]